MTNIEFENNIENKFYVTYRIVGFLGEKKAGPYSLENIDLQVDDIAGYSGVYDVVVVGSDGLPVIRRSS